MRYAKLGSTGLDVSAICLGCMSFGESSRGNHAWSLDERASREIVRQALDAGINFFDTANTYSDGSSEEILGRALRDMADRDEVVLATKVFMPMRPGRNAGGLSRKAIMVLYRDEDRAIVERVADVAGRLGAKPAQVALAWVLRNPVVTAPIVGVTKPEHLEDAIAAVDLELDDPAVAALEDPYVPHAVAGHA